MATIDDLRELQTRVHDDATSETLIRQVLAVVLDDLIERREREESADHDRHLLADCQITVFRNGAGVNVRLVHLMTGLEGRGSTQAEALRGLRTAFTESQAWVRETGGDR